MMRSTEQSAPASAPAASAPAAALAATPASAPAAVAAPVAETAVAATARQGRVPDFFIVGHPKCGTTALYEMLRRHPQIYMPELKETWFFVPELRSRFRRPGVGARPDTFEEYTALFAAAAPDQRVGEATPSYLRSLTAAARIAEARPDARIVAILREPASFLRSLHMQFVQTHVETETDLRKALALEQERREGRHIPRDSPRPQGLLYSDIVRYTDQLRRYHDAFSPEQVLVLIYDDFRRDNDATVRRVLRFLEVDDERPIEVTEANPTVRVRSQRFHHFMRSVSVGRGPVSRTLKVGVKALTSRRLRHHALRAARHSVVFADPSPPDERLMRELRGRFKGEVVALSEYLDRDLVTLWGYDAID